MQKLILRGLQSATVAFLSGGFAAMLRDTMKRLVEPGPEVYIGAAIWLALGLCLAPVLLAIAQRLTRGSNYRQEQAYQWRQAAVMSLASTPCWWLAPSLI